MFVKRILYCPGSGHELLSALGVSLVCHASSVFLVLKLLLSVIETFWKSIRWSCDQTWFAILEPLAAVLKFLKCSLFLVLKSLPVSPIKHHEQLAQGILDKTFVCESSEDRNFEAGNWCCMVIDGLSLEKLVNEGDVLISYDVTAVLSMKQTKFWPTKLSKRTGLTTSMISS